MLAEINIALTEIVQKGAFFTPIVGFPSVANPDSPYSIARFASYEDEKRLARLPTAAISPSRSPSHFAMESCCSSNSSALLKSLTTE
jgi:hypothetical protein